MERIEQFKELLKTLETEYTVKKDLFKYIGTGNPDADILIIGKETAVDANNDEQYINEMLNNFSDWKKMSDYSPEKVLEFFKNNEYSPLYPYKGQKFAIDNGNNRGTSRTWYNYQKLYNRIYYTPDNNTINFHEKFFITEVNSTPSKKTRDADTSSVQFRKDYFLKSDFIKSFPVIIISGVGYFKISESENEIENIFDVKFRKKCNAGENESQPYWIHWNEDGTRLLINTYQLSIGISDELISEVADLIKESNLIT